MNPYNGRALQDARDDFQDMFSERMREKDAKNARYERVEKLMRSRCTARQLKRLRKELDLRKCSTKYIED